MKILIATDAWHPQVNGVVRSLSTTIRLLQKMGHEVITITPDQFRTIPCPSYPEIRLAMFAKRPICRILDQTCPDAIHIATEGPIGLAVRSVCRKMRLPFTTSYATRFPEYIQARFKIPSSWTYRLLRWFHKPSAGVMVATPALQEELTNRGFSNTKLWTRGVDTRLFRPADSRELPHRRPILLYVGRVAVEKNLNAFLSLDTPGTKIIVGDGPQLKQLKARYPEVVFDGVLQGEDLARRYAAADVFVFPSRTDTFGLVMLEALASGVPVAAYPVPGPRDVIRDPRVGILSEDLGAAIHQALKLDPGWCREYAMQYSWERVTHLFLQNICLIARPVQSTNRRITRTRHHTIHKSNCGTILNQ